MHAAAPPSGSRCLCREEDGANAHGSNGVRQIADYLNARGIRTQTGGRWGVGAVHQILTRETYIGRHRFNVSGKRKGEQKSEDEIVDVAVEPIIDVVFRACIVALNLETPGREKTTEAAAAVPAAGTPPAAAFVDALGGAGNLTSVDACATRLRLVVGNQDAVNEAALKQLGARATVKVSSNALQVVLGPIADQIADEVRTLLKHPQAFSAGADIAALGRCRTSWRSCAPPLRSRRRHLAPVRAADALPQRRAVVEVIGDDDAVPFRGLHGLPRNVGPSHDSPPPVISTINKAATASISILTRVHTLIIIGIMTLRRITANLPESLLEDALEVTGKGITETLIEGLEQIRRRRFYERALALRGRVPLQIDLEASRERRRR